MSNNAINKPLTPLIILLLEQNTLGPINLIQTIKGTSSFSQDCSGQTHLLYCNKFKIGFTCRIAVIFGTLNDGSPLINTVASNICFSYRKMFQNGIDALSKIVDAFLSKSSKFYLFWIIL